MKNITSARYSSTNKWKRTKRKEKEKKHIRTYIEKYPSHCVFYTRRAT